MKTWLLRPAKKSAVFLLIAVISALMGLASLFYSLIGLVFIAVAVVGAVQYWRPRMWGWLAVFVPCVAFTALGAWSTVQDLIAYPNWLSMVGPGQIIAVVAFALLSLWVWSARPRIVGGDAPSPT